MLVTSIAAHAYFDTSQCTFEVTVMRESCNDRPKDVNCDGVVDVLDVVKTVNVASGEARNRTAAAERGRNQRPETVPTERYPVK